MAIQVIHSFRGTDSTKVYNDSVKDILPKGVYSGGKLKTGGRLRVLIEPFAGKTYEGMTVREDLNNVEVQIDKTGFVYLIGMLVKYVPLNPAIVEVLAITQAAYENMPDKDYFICFGLCDLSGGNEVVVDANLSQANRDDTPFTSSSNIAIQQQAAALYADAFLSVDYNFSTYDVFADNSNINAAASTMVFNGLLSRAEASKVGSKLVTNVLSDHMAQMASISEVMVLVDSNDPGLKIQVRANLSSAWIDAVQNQRVALGASSGNTLQLQFTSSISNAVIFSYAVFFGRITTNVGALPAPSISGGPSVTTFLGLADTPASYAGSAGKTVKVNAQGTGLEFVQDKTYAYGQSLWQQVVSGTQAKAGDHLEVDNSVSAVEIPLPVAPSVGDVVFFRPKFGTRYSLRKLTLRGGSNKIMALSTTYEVTVDYQIFDAEFIGGAVGWRISVTGSAPVA